MNYLWLEGLHFGEEAGDRWREQALHPAREVGLFSLNSREYKSSNQVLQDLNSKICHAVHWLSSWGL